MCLYPMSIRNKKYLPNKKNAGKPEKLEDMRKTKVIAGCGRCAECRKQRADSWRVRMMEEIRDKKEKYFVTLTFAEDKYDELRDYLNKSKGQLNAREEKLGNIGDSPDDNEYINEIATVATRLFLERVRKKTGKSVKHFLITERGEQKGRIHMHGIWMGNAELLREWKYGRVSIGDKEMEQYLKKKTGNFVGDISINYIVKYITKANKKYPNHIGKVLCSKGIGANAIEKLKRYKREQPIYIDKSGKKHAMPTYWKNKIYTEKERDKMWTASSIRKCNLLPFQYFYYYFYEYDYYSYQKYTSDY